MIYSNISPGKNAPNSVNVIIEISTAFGDTKYEFDKETQMLTLDRMIHTSMTYPCNYGFIPKTLGGDGDPIDVLVYTTSDILPGVMISVKPIGVLISEDNSGEDPKILAVPDEKVDPYFANINSYTDLPIILLEKIEHFFKHYKDLEKNKWVKVKGWESRQKALDIIMKGIDNYK